MVRPKSQSKKQQRRGVDFKKIKRKVGRKLPPPKNATSTEVKSKAIILSEQSVASKKEGLAVSKRGLTLKELLQQTSHHNAKVRRDALIGMRDIFLKHPEELKLQKLSVIEKLRERISDDDKLVREALYQLLKAVIFPRCKEDSQGPFISLMMAYIFNAMTHLSVDVRLMAFKFLDLVVRFYPASFSLYAEKILQNYKHILQKNRFHLQDMGKLKSVLAGLAYCLSLLPCNKRDDDSSIDDVVSDRRILHAFDSDVPKDNSGISIRMNELMDVLPILVSCFQDFLPSIHTTPLMDAHSFECVLSILQCVDLVVKFFVYGIDRDGQVLRVSPLPYTRDRTVLAVLLQKLFEIFPLNLTHQLSEKDDDRYFILNVIVSEVFLCLSDWISPPFALLEKFLEFIRSALSEKIHSSVRSGKAFRQKHSLSLIPFIPKLIMQVEGSWKSHILQAFTEVFKNSSPESSIKLACLAAIEEMIASKQGRMILNKSDPEILSFLITWIREIPLLLHILGDKNPVSSRAVLRLQLCLAQCALVNQSLAQEYDNMQYSLTEFYSTCLNGAVSYGPFLRLTRDIQESAACCLYYFSFLDPLILQSLASCCLCPDLDPFMSVRLLEVLHSSYKAGHIQTADYISFLVTLLSHYKLLPERSSPAVELGGSIKSVASVVCSYLSQIGDNRLVFKLLEKVVHQRTTTHYSDIISAQ